MIFLNPPGLARMETAAGSSVLTPIRPIACLTGSLEMKQEGIVKLA